MSATHPAPALPPPLAAPVSDETRLAYVLRHFRLAYEAIPDVAIGYATTQPTVAVINGANGFFQTMASYPPAPNYREWAGQRVPFFFDSQSDTALLTLTTGRATINADVISAAFFLLSGWQEYLSDTRDRHGRFP